MRRRRAGARSGRNKSKKMTTVMVPLGKKLAPPPERSSPQAEPEEVTSSDNENEVRTPSSNERPDLDIARDAALSLGSGGLPAVEIMRKIEDELRKATELEASQGRWEG
jgi:hypothetical protein